jgi:hypothetical protein
MTIHIALCLHPCGPRLLLPLLLLLLLLQACRCASLEILEHFE